jgi:uncharacterized protein (TIGR03435 family)
MDCRGQQPFPSAAALGAAGSDEQFARQRCGFMMVRTETGATSVSGVASMASIARLLAGFVQRPVIDGTGLAGNYAVTFTHAPGSSSNGGAGPSVFVAVEEQLGLKLQAATIAVQAVVIDHIEKPSDN